MIITDKAHIAENKLIILFISEKMMLPLSKKEFFNIIINGNLMNFFIMQHLIDDLINNDYLSNENERYLITKKGSDTLSFLIYKIPTGIKKYIIKSISSFRDSVKKEIDVKASYTFGVSNDFIANLEILESNSPLLSISFCAGTKKEAQKICDSFKKNTNKIYSEIIATLIKERN